MKFIIALWFGKFINLLINIVDSSRGTNLAGEWAMKVDKLMVSHFRGIDTSRVLFVTGTNGKSTTNYLINHILKENGKKVISNIEGANLIYGVATALIKRSTLFGKVDADYFIFETDERFLPLIREQLHAENVLITNLQKDQVQRNGDPDFIYRKLSKAFSDGVKKMFINNDEPRSRSLAKYAEKCITYGVEKHPEAFRKGASYVTMPCPYCSHKIVFDYYNTDGIGKFECSSCGYKSDEHAMYEINDVDFEGARFKYRGIQFPMPYNMPFMQYNYAAAIAVAEEFAGISATDMIKPFATFKNVEGRYEVLEYKGKTIKYMRIKQENPDTLQSSINVMAQDKSRKMVLLGLDPLVDFIPHYVNSFYAFDCDLSELVATDVERYYCFSDGVCYDVANRLVYEGVDPDIIDVEATEDPEKIFKEIEKVETDNIYMITWLHTYHDMKKYYKEGKHE